MSDPERKRRRPAISCVLCRRRKIRCNRELPCSNCVRSRDATCFYENYASQHNIGGSQPNKRALPQQSLEPSHGATVGDSPLRGTSSAGSTYPSASIAASSSVSALTPASQVPSQEVEPLKHRIRQLEEQLSRATQSPAKSPGQPSISDTNTSSRIASSFYIDHERHPIGALPRSVSGGVVHKGRLFGQSHWINGIIQFKEILASVEPHMREESSQVFSNVKKCKKIAGVIKSQQTPPWPSPPTTDLPPKNVADELVDSYLRTVESVYRILHVPSFKKDYEAFWESDRDQGTAFSVQLKLVLALGAVTYDDQFSLYESALKWVYEAMTWVSEPEFKSRLNLQALQNNLLLLLARERVGVGEDLIWVSFGSLIRTAVCMGLHRDPTRLPRNTAFATEMCRRLWNTILEISLQTSMTFGGPPMLSLREFDTEPPGNFDDDQLLTENPEPQPEQEFTQVTIAIVLRRTFPVRLAIAKYLNDLNTPTTYSELLRLDAELKIAYKSLSRTLHQFKSGSKQMPSQFATRMVDFLMHRFQTALHVPFFNQSLHESTYAFSRKVAVENSLKMWFAAFPSSFNKAAPLLSNDDSSKQDDLARLSICAAGFIRPPLMQASLLIAMELRTQLQENEESLGPAPLRSDFLSVLDDAKIWSWRCIEAGETNVKGHVLLSLVSAQIEGLRQGFEKDGLSRWLVSAAEEAGERCLQILEQKASQGQPEVNLNNIEQMSWNVPSDSMEGWDFMMSDELFNSDLWQEPLMW